MQSSSAKFAIAASLRVAGHLRGSRKARICPLDSLRSPFIILRSLIKFLGQGYDKVQWNHFHRYLVHLLQFIREVTQLEAGS